MKINVYDVLFVFLAGLMGYLTVRYDLECQLKKGERWGRYSAIASTGISTILFMSEAHFLSFVIGVVVVVLIGFFALTCRDQKENKK